MSTPAPAPAPAPSPPSPSPPPTRKTRLVLLSDTHNHSPPSAFRLPPGDVLVYAGDLTKTGSRAELAAALAWLEAAPGYQAKIVVAGNHDVGLVPQDQRAELLAKCPSLTVLFHEHCEVRLQRKPWTVLRVWGSPMSPLSGAEGEAETETETERSAAAAETTTSSPSSTRHSAFQYTPTDPNAPLMAAATNPWLSIPQNLDLLVTHTPPLSHCDAGTGRGCALLQAALAQARPKLLVCGHVHEGRGAERIVWGEHEGNVGVTGDEDGDGAAPVSEVWRWVDAAAGTKKMARIDWTARGWRREIESGAWVGGGAAEGWKVREREREGEVCGGQGVDARMDTFIVNAAIMATSWPYRAGPARYNKPIVLDLDLPVWKADPREQGE